MKRKNIFVIAGVFLIGSAASFFFGSWLPQEHRIAAGHGIDYLVDEYELTGARIEIDQVNYWEEGDRYAVRLYDIDQEKFYELALRLDDEQEAAFILDVTGSFDEFGLAYCH
ncbi:hypothetical protein SAMN05421736_106140 [Evansella caseinilytica]|uniref:Uncharacterized protein n=1 Tax=Evansella caseinilytica TaxID=1503961 RepID=A0A1H3QFF5_9BACI|nr:hypothetical protein [Evansella caseinilytica]SDZ11778.1 hypothetical protein SAMN05421736_106140 [Evansella caseinilytica]